MFFVPFLLSVAFIGPPGAVAAVHPERVAHVVRPAHAQPLVFVGSGLRLTWIAGTAKPLSRAASLSA